MGIKDLLQNLKSIQTPVNVSKYQGEVVAIDSYCWLHRALYFFAMDIIKHQDYEKLLKSLGGRIKMLLKHKIRPIFVFDGAPLKIKQKTNLARSEMRKKFREEAESLYKAGKYDLAAKKYGESASVTADIIEQFINMLKEREIEYIVAPYEADAQLAYLSLNDLVSCVFTEDSDLLVYGCKRALFKMDQDGDGMEVCMDNLQNAKELKLHKFTFDMFVVNCIMAGCDYVPNIKNIGFKKANTLVYKHNGEIGNIIKDLKREGKVEVPEDYEENFTRAYLTFKFQRVYDPLHKKLVHLHDPSEHKYGHFLEKEKSLDFLGATITDSQAFRIASAQVHATGKRWSVAKGKSKPHNKEETKKSSSKKPTPGFQTFSVKQYMAQQEEPQPESPRRFEPTLKISDSLLSIGGGSQKQPQQQRSFQQKKTNPQTILDSFVYKRAGISPPEESKPEDIPERRKGPKVPARYEPIGLGQEAIVEQETEFNSGMLETKKREFQQLWSSYQAFKEEIAHEYGVHPSVQWTIDYEGMGQEDE